MTVVEANLKVPMICRDGLMPSTSCEEHAWLRPVNTGPLSSSETVGEILRRVADIHFLNQMVWPASMNGTLQRPPDSHIVDSVVREHVLEGASDDVRNEALLRPLPMTVAVLAEPLPSCSYCRRGHARYDTNVKPPRSGWAMLCPSCYASHGVGTLGAGRGQYLLTWAELGEDIRKAIDSAKAHWEDRGIVVPAFGPWDG